MGDQAKPEKADSDDTNEARQANAAGSANKQVEQDSETPLLEWVVGILGLILVLSSISFLVYEAIKGDSLPPDVIIRPDSTIPTHDGYLVQFRAINQGQTTAKGLLIEGRLTDAGQEIETSETSLDYLPARSERQGGLFFTKNPDQFELQLRATGYEKP